MGLLRELLTGEEEPTVNPEDTTPGVMGSPEGNHNLSFYCITRDEDRHFLTAMLDTLPKGCEVVLVNTVHDPEQDGKLTVERNEELNGQHFVVATYRYAGWDFAEARNAALSLCTRGWCFWMDTDDRLIDWQHPDIIDITKLPPGIGGVWVGCYGFQPAYKDNEKGSYYAVSHLRAHRNIAGLQWRGKVHEQLDPQIRELGFTTVEADIGIYHVGYVTDRKTLTAKMGRNVLMLCQQLHTDREYLPDYYLTTLRNNINTYLDMKGQ